MNDSVLTLESTLTDRYQTPIPSAIRKALRLKSAKKSVTRFNPTAAFCCLVPIHKRQTQF